MRYYIRQHHKYVSGPHEVEAIRAWIKEGKVRDEMEFSLDGEEWMLGIEMIDLFEPRSQSRARSGSQHRGRRLRR